MTTEEIKTMFLAAATLKHCNFVDPQRPVLEATVEALTDQYETECLLGQKPVDKSKDSSSMTVEDAFETVAKMCQRSLDYELKFKPNNLDDNQVKALALACQEALGTIAAALQHA